MSARKRKLLESSVVCKVFARTVSSSPENMEVESLLQNKSKMEVAAAVRAACNGNSTTPPPLSVGAASVADGSNSKCPELLDKIVDQVLTNSKSLSDVDDEETLEWCQWLIAGGATPEEFSETVKGYDKATTCGLVWTENFVAYRCRTCGISPYLSLCTECFHNGNHEGHDYIKFKSETGGACDCGDFNIIKESGCCILHGRRGSSSSSTALRNQSSSSSLRGNSSTTLPPEPSSSSSAPPELFRVANGMMPRLFHRLIAYLRAVEARKLARAQQLSNNKNTSNKTKKSSRQKSSPPPTTPTTLAATAAAMIHSNPGGVMSPPPKGHKFIKLLQSFSDMGVSMRQVMTSALTHTPIYSNLCGEGTLPPEYIRLGLKIPSNSRTFLEELVYWTVKREFPEDLVCLLLSLRSDSNYNERFARAFITHYELISQTILRSSDPERLCKHIAAVSVQLFSKEKLAIAMVEQMQLLHLLLRSLHDMIRSTAVPISSVPALSTCPSSMESAAEQNIDDDDDDAASSPNSKILKVIDCDNDIIKNNYYWLLKSDLKEVLSHGPVATKFFSDPELLSTWFEFLTLMQGMNVNKFVKKGEPHLEHESDSYVGAFMAELVISATLMCTLVGHLKDSSSSGVTLNFIRLCMDQLKRWNNQVNYLKGTISFHLPLHRYLSTFIRQGMQWQGIPMNKILPPEEEFREVVIKQLLRLQTAYYGISTRLWARNGPSLVNQAEYYVSSLCCNSMVDADLFLLQVEAVREPKGFLEMVLEEFGVDEVLSTRSLVRKGGRGNEEEGEMDWMEEPEEQLTMLENFMIFLATLVSVRSNLGMPEQDLMALEMSVLLCKSDRLHSELMEMLPERCSNTGGAAGGGQSEGGTGADAAATMTTASISPDNFDEVLGKIADFQEPRKMQQGIFTPKAVVWEEIYDPVYTLLRSSSRAEYQSSRDRYQDWVNRAKRLQNNGGGNSNVKNLWPPFRLPPKNCGDSGKFMGDPAGILREKRFMEVAFVVLYHGVYTGLLGELTVALCVYMLELLVHLSGGDEDEVLRGFMTEIQVPGKDFQEDGSTHGENILSLLMQLYTKLSESGKYFTLKPDCFQQEEEMVSERCPEGRIGDGTFFIGKVLEKLADKLDEAKVLILRENKMKLNLDQCQGGVGGGQEISLEEKEREEKRRKAKERKLHLMNEYAMKRQQFMKQESTGSTGGNGGGGQSIEDEDEDSVASPSSPSSQQQHNSSDLIEQYQDYECVICMDKLESKPNNPFGLMTYLSPCNILGYQRLHTPEGNGPFLKGIHKETLEEFLKHYDDSSVIQHIPLDPGFGVQVQTCGHLIHLDCFNSYMSYVKKSPASSSNQGSTSVHSSASSQNSADKSVISFTYKEYTCPLCRQLGNSFLPIIPSNLIGRNSASPTNPGLLWDFSEISKMIKKRNKCTLTNGEQSAVGNFIKDINACARNNFEDDIEKLLKDFDKASPLVSAFLLTSHLRMAVERQLKLTEIQNVTSTAATSSVTPSSSSAVSSSSNKKLSSLLPLLSVLKYQYKTLSVGYSRKHAQNWEMICGKRMSKGNGKELPTLLRDVETTLYHLVLDLPLNSSTDNGGVFNGVVQVLYNLRVVQVLAAICSQFGEMERKEIGRVYSESTIKLERLMGQILKCFERGTEGESVVKTQTTTASAVKGEETAADENGNHNKNVEIPETEFLENLVESMLLPFLKTVAHLKSELWGTNFQTDSFSGLVEYLELGGRREEPEVVLISEQMDDEGGGGGGEDKKSCVDWMSWRQGGGGGGGVEGCDGVLECETVIENWCLDLMNSLNQQNGSKPQSKRKMDDGEEGGRVQRAAELLKSHLYLYDKPGLIRLPREYDTIFENYRKVKCEKCEKIPSNPALCLICGEILCLNDICCFDLELKMSEVVSHREKKCGRGTGLFLSVMTSEIWIVREKEACIWGSIFLDSFCEEDLELKRGKPLFLCQERLDILERNWISQSFYKTELKWFQHENFL